MKKTKLFERKHGLVIADRGDHTLAEWTGKCELCGKEGEELRPYGPNNENICFDCGMKDEATTNRKMDELMDGGN